MVADAISGWGVARLCRIVESVDDAKEKVQTFQAGLAPQALRPACWSKRSRTRTRDLP